MDTFELRKPGRAVKENLDEAHDPLRWMKRVPGSGHDARMSLPVWSKPMMYTAIPNCAATHFQPHRTTDWETWMVPSDYSSYGDSTRIKTRNRTEAKESEEDVRKQRSPRRMYGTLGIVRQPREITAPLSLESPHSWERIAMTCTE